MEIIKSSSIVELIRDCAGFVAFVFAKVKNIFGSGKTPALSSAVSSLASMETASHEELSPEKKLGLLSVIASQGMKTHKDGLQAIIPKYQAFYNALMLALDTDGYLLNVMARAHYDVTLHYHAAHPGPREIDADMRDMEHSARAIGADIEQKRHDLKLFMEWMDTTQFTNTAQGIIPAPKNFGRELTASTKEEIVSMLLSANQSAKDPEKAIIAAALTQELHYRALANANDPEGIASRILASAMKNLLPTITAEETHRFAKDYMRYYQREALTMAEAFKTENDLVQQAIKHAFHLQQKYGTADRAHPIAR